MALRKFNTEGISDIMDNLLAVKGPGFCVVVRAMHAMQMMSATGQGMLIASGAASSTPTRFRDVSDGCIRLVAADLGVALGVSVPDLHEAHVWSLRIMECCGFEIDIGVRRA